MALLEEVISVLEAEEGHRVGDHPDVGAAAVVVRLGPRAVLVTHRQDLVGLARSVRGLVVRVRVIIWKREREKLVKGSRRDRCSFRRGSSTNRWGH